MITILIVGNNITDNEQIAGSIIGGTELTTCVISTRSAVEAYQIAESKTPKIDLFIVSVRMKEQSGYKLSEKLRRLPEYRDCPILFVTGLSYNASGFPDLATYQSYRKHNYISLPVKRTDVQGKLGLYLEEILASQAFRRKDERAILLEHKTGEAFVRVREILFAEVQNKTCRLITESAVYEISHRSLNDLIEVIDEVGFMRCHRGFALNVRQLKGIETAGRRLWQAVFSKEAGTCLISKTYYALIFEKYQSFLLKH